MAAADILSQLDPAGRPPTHLVSAPAALAEASTRLARAMEDRHEADTRRCRLAIADSRRRLRADLSELEREKAATLRDPERISHVAAAHRATVSSDFRQTLERNHMIRPSDDADDAALAKGMARGPEAEVDTGVVGGAVDAEAGSVARRAAAKAKRATRPRPWRASADSLARVRQQSGGRYVPPERRGQSSALGFTRTEQDRLRAIERSGAARAAEALTAAQEVRDESRKARSRLERRMRRLRGAADDADDDADSDEAAGNDGTAGGEAAARSRPSPSPADPRAPLRDAELLEAAVAVARVLTSLGVRSEGGGLEQGIVQLQRWGVLPSEAAAGSAATVAAPLHVDPAVATRALAASGDLTASRRRLLVAKAGISLPTVIKSRRYAEEPQTTDAAATTVGKAIKGGGVPYKLASREEGLSGGAVAEGRKLGLTLPEILLLSRCVKHRQQRQVLDAADDEIRRGHAEERAEESRQRMEVARAALAKAWRPKGARDGGRAAMRAPVVLGTGIGGGLAAEMAAEDLVEAWAEAKRAEGAAGADAEDDVEEVRASLLREGTAAGRGGGGGGGQSGALVDVPSIDHTSTNARRLRRYEEAHGQTLGLATRIDLLTAMLAEAKASTTEDSEEKALTARLLNPADVAGVGLDAEAEDAAALARRRHSKLKQRWKARSKARRSMLGRGAQPGTGGQGGGSGGGGGGSGDESDGSDGEAGQGGGVARRKVAAAGWQPRETGVMTVDRARSRLLAPQVQRRAAEDESTGVRGADLPRRFVEWPEAAVGAQGEALALPEQRLDEALEDGRRALRRAHTSVGRLEEARRTMPRAAAERIRARDLARLDGDDAALRDGASPVDATPPAAGAGDGAPASRPLGRTWRSEALLGAGERAAMASLGVLPELPRGREAWRLRAEALIGERPDGAGMERHEVQLELRALLEQRHNDKVRRGEASRTGLGIERVFFAKLITNRSLGETL